MVEISVAKVQKDRGSLEFFLLNYEHYRERVSLRLNFKRLFTRGWSTRVFRLKAFKGQCVYVAVQPSLANVCQTTE